ncbi:hypothetical protein C0992_005740, partial [Termitomyces sp. T32_za158]
SRENINCGHVGLSNLEKRHRGKKKCLERQAKVKKGVKETNSTLLSFLQPKPTPVPLTVAPPPLILASGPLKEAEKEDVLFVPVADLVVPASITPEIPHIINRLRTLFAKIPDSVPLAEQDGPLANYATDPGAFNDPGIDAFELWQTLLNPMLKWTWGWGTEINPHTIIRRGSYGMDGLLNFLEYFVKRGVPEDLIEGKMGRVIAALEEM